MRTVDVVVGVLCRDTKILIAQRPADKDYAGFWEFPGGKVELGEVLERAMIRELQEELGIIAEQPQFIFSSEYQYPDKRVLLNIFLITQFQGEPVGLEQQQIQWIVPKDISEYKILGANVEIIQRLQPYLAQTLYEN